LTEHEAVRYADFLKDDRNLRFDVEERFGVRITIMPIAVSA
jgi:hypothetical protein